jgi:hypothetical protein
MDEQQMNGMLLNELVLSKNKEFFKNQTLLYLSHC